MILYPCLPGPLIARIHQHALILYSLFKEDSQCKIQSLQKLHLSATAAGPSVRPPGLSSSLCCAVWAVTSMPGLSPAPSPTGFGPVCAAKSRFFSGIPEHFIKEEPPSGELLSESSSLPYPHPATKHLPWVHGVIESTTPPGREAFTLKPPE